MEEDMEVFMSLVYLSWSCTTQASDIDFHVPGIFIKVISVLCYYLTAASNNTRVLLVQTSGCKVHKTRRTANLVPKPSAKSAFR